MFFFFFFFFSLLLLLLLFLLFIIYTPIFKMHYSEVISKTSKLIFHPIVLLAMLKINPTTL